MELNARYGFVAGHPSRAGADVARGRRPARRAPRAARRADAEARARPAAGPRRERAASVDARPARADRSPARHRRRRAREWSIASAAWSSPSRPICRAGRASRWPRILRRALRTPVIVDNDVNLAILGEHWQGAARGHDNCAFVEIGTGIGAGVMIGGRLHHGHHYLAGEIALMCMAPQHVDTDFGSKGCLESLAGLEALAARWSHRRARERAQLGGVAARRRGERRSAGAQGGPGDDDAHRHGHRQPERRPRSVDYRGGRSALRARPELLESVRQVVSKIVPTPARIVTSALGDEAPLIGSVLVATIEARAQMRRQLLANGAS